VPLPTDSHVHSEWSWDALQGSMERTCAQAVAVGLPAVAFTEHLDHTVWCVEPDEIDPSLPLETADDGEQRFRPPPLDVAGYLACVERCREEFPELRVLSGVEVGEPHWHEAAVRRVLDSGPFDRVLGSLHCLPDGGRFREPVGLFAHQPPVDVVRSYLLEVAELVTRSDAFSVLGHIDYPFRSWPSDEGPVDPAAFEDEFRLALRATAQSGRALEINTVVPLDATILRWWHEEGGEAVTFGSDAHEPAHVGRDFRAAADMAEAHGFRPGPDPFGLWARA
jgi:histidinol-phosphatase (PHP family)